MKRPPHIIIFNPDQWRGDVLGHAGNPAAVTPTLDNLVEREAVSFTNAFCQNPVCTPSRCSFMTGWYPHVRGHRTMHHMLHAEQGDPNLLRILKENGYFVWSTSRNDLVPAQHGFENDADIWFSPSGDDYRRWGHSPRFEWHVDESWRGDPGSDTYYSLFAGRLDKGTDDICADVDWGFVLGAIDCIRNHDDRKPLCLFLPIFYPHPPYCVEEPWHGMIDRSLLPARVPAPADWEGKPALLRGIQEGQNLGNWSEERWTELRATYYGMCARVDHQLGLVIEALREKGLYDDAALFFFSDHGDFTGDYGLVEKTQNTFEDCLTHVPFVFKPPARTDIRPGPNDALVELVDFTATVFDLSGIEPGYASFGRSVLPLVAGKTDRHRDAVFCEGGRLDGERQAMELESLPKDRPPEESFYWPRLRLQTAEDPRYGGKAAMCRTRTHKYVRRLYEHDELYDLKKDPQELRNVIDDPDYAEVLTRLRERMATWYMETCDVVPEEIDRRF